MICLDVTGKNRNLNSSDLNEFKHNFRETFNIMCSTNDRIEDTAVLPCPFFDMKKPVLLPGFSSFLRQKELTSLSRQASSKLVLHGDNNAINNSNKNLISFIKTAGRLK